jgi:predicted nucleic-acid-binding protein
MIGLDTNIIVRYLVGDDPIQSRKARQLIEGRLTEDEPGFLSLIAVAETTWVLERGYGMDGRAIAAAIERLLQTEVLVIECEQEVFSAMIALREGRGSFADALIGECGKKAGCATTVTFDRKALRLSNFEPL